MMSMKHEEGSNCTYTQEVLRVALVFLYVCVRGEKVLQDTGGS